MRKRRCCRNNKIGLYFAAFGFGMFISMLCPKNFTVAVLSATIIILGIIISK